MASTADGTSYEDSGGGAGGKFRKRPFRRSHTTPYDRPHSPAALRNPRSNSWLSKLVVDPASKLLSSSARLFFSSSLFRKRLPATPPSLLPPPEANQESSDRFQGVVLDDPPGVQSPFANDGCTSINSGNNCGLSELEQILKQKTFTRSEIDHLTELLRSRTVDVPHSDEDSRTQLRVSQLSSAAGRQHEFTCSPMQKNGIEPRLESHKFHERVSTPVASSLVREDEVAAPAELAKAYMSSKPSQMSPSRYDLCSQTLREDASVLNNGPYTPKSVTSLVPKAVRFGVPESAIFTPRSRGRSAIHSMARTPYYRVNPTATLKGTGPIYDDYGRPSPSSSQFAWENDVRYSSKQLALKRRSSVLEDNIRSIGPIRRLRQKTNLSTPKTLSLQAPGSPFSNRGTGGGPASGHVGLSSVHNIPSSAHNIPSLDNSKDGISKALGENDDNSRPGTSNYTPVPSKSTEMATKILQQLDKLVPKERSSEGNRVSAGEKSTSKLTTKMSNGQAVRILEDVDSLSILHNADVRDVGNSSLFDARDTSSQNQNKMKNGQQRLVVASDTFAPSGINNVTVSVKEAVHGFKTDGSVSSQSVPQPSQNKWGFQMSAHEDFLELDDEIHSNKVASTLSAEGTTRVETSVVESKTFSSKAVMVDKTGAVSDFQPLANAVFGKATDVETCDGNVVGESELGFTFPVVPPRTTSQLVGTSQSTSAFDQIVPLKKPNAPAPLSSFGSGNVNEMPSISFSYSSSASDSSVLTTSAPLEPQPESSNSLANVACATDTIIGIKESDKGGDKNLQKSGYAVGKPEASISSPFPTSTSTGSIFSFCAQPNSPSLNGSLGSSSSTFGSPFPAPASSIFRNPSLMNSFTNVVYSNTVMDTKGTTSDSSHSTSAAAPSLLTAPSFQIGSTSVVPMNSILTVSSTSTAETIDLKAKTDKKETTFGNPTTSSFWSPSIATTGAGSNIFGFSASAASSATNSHFQGSIFGKSSASMPFKYGSSGSNPISGTAETTSLTPSTCLFSSTSSISSTSLFGSSTSSTSLHGFSAPKAIGSNSCFGSSSLASNSISSISSPPSSLLCSSSQLPKSSIFSSTMEPPPNVLSFCASSVSATATNSAPMAMYGSSSGPPFSFTSAAASASSFQTQPVFGNSDQMNMDDSMAEDHPVQASTPPIPVFGQNSTPSSGFMFDSTVPSPGNLFPFNSQQNQSPPSFQASGSLDFAAGGSSFSLGSGGGGGDKANRRIVRVKHKTRRR